VAQLRILTDGLPVESPAPGEPEPATVSVTGLVTLASCPLRYYWSEVDRLPRRPSAAAHRGVALHRRIELHNRGTIAFDDLGDEHYDAPADPGGAPTAAGSAMEVFLSSRFADRRPAFIETPIDLRLGDARVRGRIDAVYEDADGGWEIVDYKSGRPASDRAAVVQLEAYAVAARRGAVAPSPPERLAVTFLYLGGEEAREVTHHADAPWIDRAEHHLTELIAASAGPDFAPSPSASCRHCDFVKFCDAGKAFLDGA
jgi:RecB family exonuclease